MELDAARWVFAGARRRAGPGPASRRWPGRPARRRGRRADRRARCEVLRLVAAGKTNRAIAGRAVPQREDGRTATSATSSPSSRSAVARRGHRLRLPARPGLAACAELPIPARRRMAWFCRCAAAAVVLASSADQTRGGDRRWTAAANGRRDRGHRRRPGRAGRRLPPGRRGPPVRDPRRHERVGDTWRNRWDSLRLFTPGPYDGLPAWRFPASAGSARPRTRWPTTSRRTRRGSSCRSAPACAVDAARPATATGSWSTPATARFDGRQRRRGLGALPAAAGCPPFADELDPGIVQLHSSDYRNPRQLRAGGVLVVGAGQLRAPTSPSSVAPAHPTWLAGPHPGQRCRPGPAAGSTGSRAGPCGSPSPRCSRSDAGRPQAAAEAADGGGPADPGEGARTWPPPGVERVPQDVPESATACPCWRTGGSSTWPTSSGAPGSGTDFSWIDLPVFDAGDEPRQRPRRGRLASPASTSSGCTSSPRSSRPWSAGSATTPSMSSARSPGASPLRWQRAPEPEGSLHEIEPLLLALIVAVAGLSVLARVVRVPYPILLVLGGLALGFVPGMPAVELPPELVLVVFLPPLLYCAGFFASPRDLRADAGRSRCSRSGWSWRPRSRWPSIAHAMVAGHDLAGGVRPRRDRLAHRPPGRHRHRPPPRRAPPPGHPARGREPGQRRHRAGRLPDRGRRRRRRELRRLAGRPAVRGRDGRRRGRRAAGRLAGGRAAAAARRHRWSRSWSRCSPATPPTCRPRCSASPGCWPR